MLKEWKYPKHPMYNQTEARPDMVEALLDKRPVDLVEILYDNPHGLYCEYRPWVNDQGVVYCLTCESSIGSIKEDPSAWLCRSCGCPKTCHHYDTNRCLECGANCR